MSRHYHRTMRPVLTVILVGALGITSCSTIADNVSVDVKGIVASTCQQLATGFANQLADAVAELDAGTDATLPNIDVSELIERASDLGCSPDDLEALVRAKLGELEATSDAARIMLEQVSDDLDQTTGA